MPKKTRLLYVASSVQLNAEAESPALPDPRPEIWLAGDESGTLQFNGQPHDRYFLVATITVDDAALWTDLRALDEALSRASRRTGRRKPFHANKDTSDVRQKVFDLMLRHSVVIDATILDKEALEPSQRSNRLALYTILWTGHLSRVLPRLFYPNRKVTIDLADLGKLSKAPACLMAVNNATGSAFFPHYLRAIHGQYDDPPVENAYDIPAFRWRWAAASDVLPIQLGDYAAWAIRRKWEGDDRWYQGIKPLIHDETMLSIPSDAPLDRIVATPKRSRPPEAASPTTPTQPPVELIAGRSRHLTPETATTEELEEALFSQAAHLDEYDREPASYVQFGDEVIRLGEALISSRPGESVGEAISGNDYL